jgi:Flp pilus assembly secretin CpaC
MLIASLALAVLAQTSAEPVSTDVPTQAEKTLLLGHHLRVPFSRDVRRIAVANSDVLSAELLDTRELLITAGAPGSTSLAVWFENGEVEETLYSVRRDLSLLRELLNGIDPEIAVEFAPDRDFVILRGTVANAAIRDAAGATAESYLLAGSGRTEVPILTTASESAVSPAEGNQGRRRSGRAPVANLLRVAELPTTLDRRIEEAIAPLTGSDVRTRRIQVGSFPDDAVDVFLLEGTVPDQVTLTRALYIASRAILGASRGAGNNEVRVLTDEAGALSQRGNGSGANSGGGQQGGLQSGSNSAIGGGGQQSAQLANRITTQVGRAKAVEAAGGRILSTIQVEHLPLVRVDVRLYEVNTGKLRTWRNQLQVAGSDFDQPDLSPAPESTVLQGDAARGVGDGDVQGLLGFLNGTVAGRGQAVAGGFAIDSLFQLLVEEDVARTLSNPSLAVLSGELAQFQVGGQVPIPSAVTFGGGTNQVLNSVEFRDFGINLTVRPLVEERSSSRITLDVVPQISMPDLALTAAIGSATGQATAATAFESRATRTHARVFDGEPFVIGGLSTQRSQSARSRAPLVGSLPVIGWLFRNEADDSQETELVIVVTPSIVREPRPEAALWAFPSSADILRRCRDRVSLADHEDSQE